MDLNNTFCSDSGFTKMLGAKYFPHNVYYIKILPLWFDEQNSYERMTVIEN